MLSAIVLCLQVNKFPCHRAARLCIKLGFSIEKFLDSFEGMEKWISTDIWVCVVPSTGSFQCILSALQLLISLSISRETKEPSYPRSS